MASKKTTTTQPSNGIGVKAMVRDLVSHAKSTGHGINDVAAELLWAWMNSNPHD